MSLCIFSSVHLNARAHCNALIWPQRCKAGTWGRQLSSLVSVSKGSRVKAGVPFISGPNTYESVMSYLNHISGLLTEDSRILHARETSLTGANKKTVAGLYVTHPFLCMPLRNPLFTLGLTMWPASKEHEETSYKHPLERHFCTACLFCLP